MTQHLDLGAVHDRLSPIVWRAKALEMILQHPTFSDYDAIAAEAVRDLAMGVLDGLTAIQHDLDAAVATLTETLGAK